MQKGEHESRESAREMKQNLKRYDRSDESISGVFFCGKCNKCFKVCAWRAMIEFGREKNVVTSRFSA